MENVYGTSGKRTILYDSRYKLSTLGCGETEAAAFENCKQAPANQFTLKTEIMIGGEIFPALSVQISRKPVQIIYYSSTT